MEYSLYLFIHLFNAHFQDTLHYITVDNSYPIVTNGMKNHGKKMQLIMVMNIHLLFIFLKKTMMKLKKNWMKWRMWIFNQSSFI